ncbi:hypothetical protein KSS87_015374, partial [Heliosperma pusillum]
MAVSSFNLNLNLPTSQNDTVSTKTSSIPSFILQCKLSTSSPRFNTPLRITHSTCPRHKFNSVVVNSVVPEGTKVLEADIGGNSPPGDNGGDGNGGGGGGGGGGGDGEDEEGMEFGVLLKLEDVLRESDKGSVWPLGFLMRHFGWLRNRMLADPAFLFKVGTEIVIDSCCATFAEVQKRGKDFWAEFELYLADLLVGVVVNVALVGMLAPYARIGQRSVSAGFFGGFSRACRDLPS